MDDADGKGKSDALVLFGATGDLAKKKIFPAMYHLQNEDNFDAAVVGVASSDWSTEDLRTRARESIAAAVKDADEAVVKSLLDRMCYVSGDYREAETYKTLAGALQGCERPLFYLAIPPVLFDDVIEGIAKVDLAKNGRVVVEKPFGRDRAVGGRAQRDRPQPRSPRSRCSASTTTSGRSRWRTSWCSGSPTRCSSRSGTATSSRTCRSPCPNSSGSKGGARSTTPSARCATSCRTTCSRSSPCWRWSRRPPPTKPRCATRR